MAHEIRARLTEPAWESWDRLCASEGVTLTALLEALGRELGDQWQPTQRVLKAAREIDWERRSRR